MNIAIYDYIKREFFQSEEEFFNAVIASFTKMEGNKLRDFKGHSHLFSTLCAAHFIEVDKDQYRSFLDIDQYHRFVDYIQKGVADNQHVIHFL